MISSSSSKVTRKGLDMQSSTHKHASYQKERHLRVLSQLSYPLNEVQPPSLSPKKLLLRNDSEKLSLSDKKNMGFSFHEETPKSKVTIKHEELVEFTKKFALEKADYEDKIDTYSKQLKILNLQLVDKDKTVERLTQQNIKLRNELAGHASQKSNNNNQEDEVYNLLKTEQTRNEQLEKLLTAIEEQRERALNERIYEGIKYNNELEAMRKQSKEVEEQLIQKIQLLEELNTSFTLQIGKLRKVEDSYQRLFNENRELNQKVTNYQVQLRKLQISIDSPKMQDPPLFPKTPHPLMHSQTTSSTQQKAVGFSKQETNANIEQQINQQQQNIQTLRRRINFLEIQNEHLQEQLRLTEQKNSSTDSQIIHQNKALTIELNDKNRKLFELSTQLGTMKKNAVRKNSMSPEEKHQNLSEMTAKCCELQSHIEVLNRKIIQLQNMNSRLETQLEVYELAEKQDQRNNQIMKLKGQLEEKVETIRTLNMKIIELETKLVSLPTGGSQAPVARSAEKRVISLKRNQHLRTEESRNCQQQGNRVESWDLEGEECRKYQTRNLFQDFSVLQSYKKENLPLGS